MHCPHGHVYLTPVGRLLECGARKSRSQTVQRKLHCPEHCDGSRQYALRNDFFGEACQNYGVRKQAAQRWDLAVRMPPAEILAALVAAADPALPPPASLVAARLPASLVAAPSPASPAESVDQDAVLVIECGPAPPVPLSEALSAVASAVQALDSFRGLLEEGEGPHVLQLSVPALAATFVLPDADDVAAFFEPDSAADQLFGFLYEVLDGGGILDGSSDAVAVLACLRCATNLMLTTEGLELVAARSDDVETIALCLKADEACAELKSLQLLIEIVKSCYDGHMRCFDALDALKKAVGASSRFEFLVRLHGLGDRGESFKDVIMELFKALREDKPSHSWMRIEARKDLVQAGFWDTFVSWLVRPARDALDSFRNSLQRGAQPDADALDAGFGLLGADGAEACFEGPDSVADDLFGLLANPGRLDPVAVVEACLRCTAVLTAKSVKCVAARGDCVQTIAGCLKADDADVESLALAQLKQIAESGGHMHCLAGLDALKEAVGADSRFEFLVHLHGRGDRALGRAILRLVKVLFVGAPRLVRQDLQDADFEAGFAALRSNTWDVDDDGAADDGGAADAARAYSETGTQVFLGEDDTDAYVQPTKDDDDDDDDAAGGDLVAESPQALTTYLYPTVPTDRYLRQRADVNYVELAGVEDDDESQDEDEPASMADDDEEPALMEEDQDESMSL